MSLIVININLDSYMWLVATVWSTTVPEFYGIEWKYLFSLDANKGFVLDFYTIVRICSLLFRATETNEPVAGCLPSL